MNLYKGTSRNNKALVYVSMNRHEEETITRVLTRLLRKTDKMTFTEQDILKDLLRGFVFEGKSVTKNQFDNISGLTSAYKIRFSLVINDNEISDTKNQYGQVPAKRRMGVMEKELRTKKFQGKWDRDTVADFLAQPNQEERDAINSPVPEFMNRLGKMVDEICQEARHETLADVRTETSDQVNALKLTVKRYSDRVIKLQRELDSMQKRHKMELEYVRDSFNEALETKFNKLQEEAEEAMLGMILDQTEKHFGTLTPSTDDSSRPN